MQSRVESCFWPNHQSTHQFCCPPNAIGAITNKLPWEYFKRTWKMLICAGHMALFKKNTKIEQIEDSLNADDQVSVTQIQNAVSYFAFAV